MPRPLAAAFHPAQLRRHYIESSESAKKDLARRALRGSRQHCDQRLTNSHSTSPSTCMTYVHVRAAAAQKHQNRLITNNSQQPAPSLGSRWRSGTSGGAQAGSLPESKS